MSVAGTDMETDIEMARGIRTALTAADVQSVAIGDWFPVRLWWLAHRTDLILLSYCYHFKYFSA